MHLFEKTAPLSKKIQKFLSEIVLKVERRKGRINPISSPHKSQHQQSISKTEELIIAEENKEQSEFPQENHSEKQDNRLPYEPPTLRKHGKVNNATQTVPVPTPEFDAAFGIPWADFS